MTTRSTFKIEDPARGIGRVDFKGPDEGLCLEGTPPTKTLYVGRIGATFGLCSLAGDFS
jgi:hypothetical protein